MSDDVLKLLSVMVEGGLVYTPLGGWGVCRRCGFAEDLRMGACFECSDFVKGKNHGDGIHELWDRNRPENRWYVTIAPPRAR